MENDITEVIFIGLPGPTHHYGGLSADNVASNRNRGFVSNPKLAARQAISLAKALNSLGLVAGFFPPQLRPHLPFLAEHFPECKTTDELIATAAQRNPKLLECASSSSAMWAANAATVSPCPDTIDGTLHLSIANLYTNPHRRIEAADTYALLRTIFANVPQCHIHAPLETSLRDEGAANHMRLAPSHSATGLNVFVYGADGSEDDAPSARQDLSASQAIAQRHQLSHTLFIKQNPAIIQNGVFHNDVIAVSNLNVLLVHEQAFADSGAIESIAQAYAHSCSDTLHVLTIRQRDLTVEEAVNTYLFNSQIVSKPNGKMAIIAPQEVAELYDGQALKLLHAIRDDAQNPIDEIITLDLRQSMRNGGGPACLRLRVAMTQAQLAALREHTHVLATEQLMHALDYTIECYYPEELTTEDLSSLVNHDNCQMMRTAMLALMKLEH